ncbi:DNA invertase Pin-like site-specific DNA recombinase [Anaerosolibacter carboniphilus]|uniref:DNA invertase Pin-like site-specific DNA recombinase n=1 Tax=Anaerosolibacter carboniphilus TaxID=1417629 RepID=A0A841KXM0_9FIRM|nr:recombinase family protein [Anaerosolibacter carboniphilus]MBB6218097.1 DNA invertase Pin-like site-specific DNA recombinase [Anaerosolibacter carboniphilus]
METTQSLQKASTIPDQIITEPDLWSYVSPYDKAATYARISGEKNSNSILAQIELAKDTLSKEKLILFDIYTDEESATKLPYRDRPGFKRLLTDACKGEFKTVIVFRRDRLARSFEDFKEIKTIFKNHDIRILFSNKGEYQSTGDVMSDFIENIIISMDEFEAALINERTEAGRIEKKDRGEYQHGGSIPYGYKIETKKISERRKLINYIQIKVQTDFIKWVFESYLKIGENNYSMDTLLSEAPTKGGPKKKYTSAMINRIIERSVYAGHMFKHGTSKKIKTLFYRDSDAACLQLDMEMFNKMFAECSNVDTIIPLETWHKALIKRFENYRPQKEKTKNYLFKDMLFCGNKDCKENKIRLVSKKYYKCSTKSCFSIHKDAVIETLSKQIVNDIVNSEKAKNHLKNKINNIESTIQKLDLEYKACKTKTSKIIMKHLDSINSSSIPEELEYATKEEKEYQSKILEQQSTLNKLNETIYMIDSFKPNFSTTNIVSYLQTDIDLAQNMLKEIISKVVLTSSDQEGNRKQKKCEIKDDIVYGEI